MGCPSFFGVRWLGTAFGFWRWLVAKIPKRRPVAALHTLFGRLGLLGRGRLGRRRGGRVFQLTFHRLFLHGSHRFLRLQRHVFVLGAVQNHVKYLPLRDLRVQGVHQIVLL